MFNLAIFIRFCQSGLDGVEFSSDNKVLISTPEGLIDYLVPKTCEIINGGDSELKSSFLQCIKTIKTLKFEEKSSLKCIYPYVFKGSTLTSVDMSNCHHLSSLNRSVFHSCRQLSNIVLPEGMTSLMAGSLIYLDSLKSIKIPDSVEFIEGYVNEHAAALSWCSQLSEVILTENSNLKTIGGDAFTGSNLTSFYIPRNASDVSLGLFNTKISKIEIHPENIYYNFDGTALLSKDNRTIFYLKYEEGMTYVVPPYVKIFSRMSCRANPLKAIVFNHEIEKIEDFVFASTNIETFNCPRGIKSIESRVFERCKSLTTVHLTENITKINVQAFYDCSKLTTINLVDGITEIGDRAFFGCNNLVNFICPKGLVKIGTGVFNGCNKLVFDKNGNEKFNVENKILFVDGTSAQEYFGDGGEVVIPSTCRKITDYIFNNKPITKVTIESNETLEIGKSAFSGSKISEIVLPKCLSMMDESAFSNIKTLKTVKIHSESSLESISLKCFQGDAQLSVILLPNNILTVKELAFEYCTALSSIDLTKTKVTTLQKKAFLRSGLTSIVFPSTLNTIGEECFSFTSLKKITFDASTISIISEKTFSDCTDLTDIEFSDSITSINSLSFSSCTSLLSVVFPLHIKLIRVNAFNKCENLKNFTLKHNCDLETIEGRAFNGCDKLKDIFVDEDDEKFYAIDGYLMDKNITTLHIFLPSSKTTIFVVPATIQSISNYAFCGCRNLRTIVIPEGSIKSVGFKCFEGCTSLSSLYFPRTLTEFGNLAFENCPSLSCGSVVYPHSKQEDIDNAIKAGIPKVAFETECISAKCMTCKNTQQSQIFRLFLVSALFIY